MRLRFSLLADMPRRALYLALLVCVPAFAQSVDILATGDKVTRRLPNLQGMDARQPQFGVVGQSATLGYQDRQEKWGAKLDGYLRPDSAVTFDYGRALRNDFGAGGSFTRQNEKSEVVLSGVYEPKKNIRLLMTGAQLRADGSYFARANGPSENFLQNSYLVGARKYWSKYEYLSDIGLAAYNVQGNAAAPSKLSVLDDPAAFHVVPQNDIAVGRQDGFLLNLNLRPTTDSNLELQRAQSHSIFHLGARNTSEDSQGSNRISYAHFFDDCVRLQGGYSGNASSDRLDLGLSRKNWNLQLSRQQGSASSDTAIRIGYTLVMDRAEFLRREGCRGKPYNPAIFEPLVNAAVKRPDQFPRDPLAIVQPR
jgi:hypothetical protein